MVSPELNNIQLKFGVNTFMSFEVEVLKCDFIQMIHMIQIQMIQIILANITFPFKGC